MASGSACPLLRVASGQEEPAPQWDKPTGVFLAALNPDPHFFTIIYVCTEQMKARNFGFKK